MKTITEDQNIHAAWYMEAREQTMETLPAFLKKLTEEFNHDYGTICHAIAACALGTAWAVNKSDQGGITGFQSGAVMWGFISHWGGYEGKPMCLRDYSDMLYPQYEEKFTTITSDTWEYLKKEAAKKIAETPDMAPHVLAHMQSIVAGTVPFGMKIR